ncbi:MAG: hypothetical protein M1457_12980 [bacterium]|nr:hypothetical protein [bacterium]
MDRREFLTASGAAISASAILSHQIRATAMAAGGAPMRALAAVDADSTAPAQPKPGGRTTMPGAPGGGGPNPGFRIGVESVLPGDGWWTTIYGRFLGETYDESIWIRSLKELGAEFTLFYDSLCPAKKEACRRIADMCERHGMNYLYNNTYGDIYGPWVKGTGRAEYSDEQLTYAGRGAHFKGIILDEVSHRQVHHRDCGPGGAVGGPGAYLADVAGVDLPTAYDRLFASVQRIVGRYGDHGGATVGELVFPILAHLYARAGMIPAPKFCSFSYPSVYFAICAGAARQYQTPLWIVHDLWGPGSFWGQIAPFAPGFSVEEYRSSLLLAYWLGADAAYTEGVHNLIFLSKLTDHERQIMAQYKVPHRAVDQNEWVFERRYSLNAYGKIHRWFATHYVPHHPRSYTFRDIRPRIAIVRFPDSCWARPTQGSLFQTLYGPGGPQPEARHLAWLDLWPILTHGASSPQALSLHGTGFMAGFIKEIADRVREIDASAGYPTNYAYTPERIPFCPIDGVLVFDHRVGKEHLKDAELIILTGELISEATQAAAMECVAAGADCLSLDHLAPRDWRRDGSGEAAAFTYGNGKVLVTARFGTDAVKDFIRPHLGPKDQIRYQFGGEEVVVRRATDYDNALLRESDFAA